MRVSLWSPSSCDRQGVPLASLPLAPSSPRGSPLPPAPSSSPPPALGSGTVRSPPFEWDPAPHVTQLASPAPRPPPPFPWFGTECPTPQAGYLAEGERLSLREG